MMLWGSVLVSQFVIHSHDGRKLRTNVHVIHFLFNSFPGSQLAEELVCGSLHVFYLCSSLWVWWTRRVCSGELSTLNRGSMSGYVRMERRWRARNLYCDGCHDLRIVAHSVLWWLDQYIVQDSFESDAPTPGCVNITCMYSDCITIVHQYHVACIADGYCQFHCGPPISRAWCMHSRTSMITHAMVSWSGTRRPLLNI